MLVSIVRSCLPGKGFLAADESAGPWLRAGHAEAAKIPDAGLELLIFCGLGVDCIPVGHGLAWIENMSQILR